MGGSVGLKGTDTAAILSEARARGAVPQAAGRATVVLDALASARPGLELLAAPGAMGEVIARDAGLSPTVVGTPAEGATVAADTRAAALAMAAAGARLILFAGGDGTARDMAAALDDRVPVIGVPAGVKMHSAVYATSPRAAADLALRALTQDSEPRPREVMDIDEEAFRAGAVSARLYGYLSVPYAPDLTQGVKVGGVSGDREALHGIAAEITGRMEAERLYILGPGTTTRAVTEALGLPKTSSRRGPGAGRGAARGRRERGGYPARAVGVPRPAPSSSPPSAARGIFWGAATSRSVPAWSSAVGLDRLLVAATPEKLASLGGGTLHVDTGDPDLDRALAGWRRVVTGYRSEAVCRVE